MPFSPEVKTAMFTRCMRHCCLCRKQCGTNIEAAHIQDEAAGGSNDEGNGIPLCFDCHQEVGAYRDSHPKGNKFRPEELRQRRDAVYELVRTGKLGPGAASVASEPQINAAVYLGPNAISAHGQNAIVMGSNAVKIDGPIVHNTPEKKPEPPELSELEFKILVAVGRGHRVTVPQVATEVQVTEQAAKYYLDELSRNHRYIDWYGNMNRGGRDHYMLTHEGRGLLVRQGII
jgi:hypothetical protein